jgi:cytochrome oxidase Cu insertion factor (SCO1/SenC/PrrC family)
MAIRMLCAALLAAAMLMPAPLSAAEHAGAGERRGVPVRTGDLAPDFTLRDQDGRSHSLSAERGKRPVVLVFYRGYW